MRRFQSHLLTLAMLAADGLAFVAFWRGAHALREALAESMFAGPINAYSPYYTHALIPFLLLWWAVLAGCGHYFHHRRISSLNELRRVVQAGFIMMLAMPALAFILKEYSLGRSVLFLSWSFLFLYLYLSRTALRWTKQSLIRRDIGRIKALILGTGPTALHVAQSVRDHPEVGYELIGFVGGDEAEASGGLGGAPILGRREDLPRLVAQTGAEEVFIADPNLSKDELLNLVVKLEGARVMVKTVSNIWEIITREFKEDDIADFPVMNLRDGRLPPSRAFVKRAFDLAFALATAPLWAPLWLVIALVLRARQGGPVLFTHERVGRDGRAFRLYKFRTMTPDTPPHAVAPADAADPRITSAGRWLRRTSLDELPQILNVLKGEMSLVGPRPEMPFIVEQYEEWQRRRLDVKPGLTGLWQVIGRKNLPLQYYLEYDFYYIRNQSLWLDISILLRTIPAVIFGKGAF